MNIPGVSIDIPQELLGAKVADLTDVNRDWNCLMLGQWLP